MAATTNPSTLDTPDNTGVAAASTCASQRANTVPVQSGSAGYPVTRATATAPSAASPPPRITRRPTRTGEAARSMRAFSRSGSFSRQSGRCGNGLRRTVFQNSTRCGARPDAASAKSAANAFPVYTVSMGTPSCRSTSTAASDCAVGMP